MIELRPGQYTDLQLSLLYAIRTERRLGTAPLGGSDRPPERGPSRDPILGLRS